MALKIIVSWAYIMQNAKEQGKLRKEGKFKEADELEQRLKDLVYKADEVSLGMNLE